MASVRTDKVQVNVEINGQKAGQTLKDLRSDVRQLSRELENLTPGTEAFNKKAAELRAAKARLSEVRQEVESTGKEMNKLSEIGNKLKGVLAVAFAAVAAAAVSVGAKIAEIVINSEQVERKFRKVFGDAAGIVDDFARNNATSIGLTANQFKSLAAATGDLLVPLGMTRGEAAKMSVEVTKLAGALAAWTNGEKDTAEVSEILQKALLGERDGLKALGISITEAELSARLLEKGQSKLTGTMLENAKATASYELILEKSKDAQNNFENGADTMAQKLTKAKAQISQVAENIANRMAPAILEAVNWFGKLTGAVQDYGEQKFSDKLAEEQMSLNGLVRSITQHNENNALRQKLLQQLQAQYPAFLGNLSAETVTNDQLLGRLKQVNEEYRKKILISAQDENVKGILDRQKEALVGMAQAQKAANMGMQDLVKLGADIDLSAPLEQQFEQYQALVKQWRSTGMNQQEIANAFFGGDQSAMLTTLARVEGGIQRLIGGNADYNLSTKQLEEETANYDKLLKQLGLSLEDVNGLMSEDASAAAASAAASTESAANAKKAMEQRKKDQKKFVADMAAAAKNIQDLQLQMIEDPFEKRREQVKLETERKIEALVGTPEQVARQAALLRDAMLLSMQEIDADQSQQLAQLQEHRDQMDEQNLAKQLDQMQRAAAREELELEVKFSNQIDAEAAHEQALYDLRQTALSERLQLLIDNGQAETALAKEIEDEKLRMQIDHNKKAVENERKTADFKKNMALQGASWVSQAIDIGIEALSMDDAARKKNAGLIKAFSVGKVFVDLLQEVAGYMASPASVASGGAVGAVLSGLATARAAVAVAKIQNQEFAHGGVIPSGNLGRFVAGIPQGPSHAGGGIRLTDNSTGRHIGEMEGGEPIMVLSKHTYANNQAVVDRLLYNSMYRNGAPIFEKGGIIGTAPSGSVPSSPQLQELIAEIAALRADVGGWQMSLRAYVTLTDIKEAEVTEAQIRRDSRIG